MTIKINHSSGWIKIKADAVVGKMSLPHYRKLMKLFAQWGTPEQHKEFFQFLVPYIGEATDLCNEIEAELLECHMKADGRLPTVMTRTYWEGEVKKRKSKLNGAKTKLKRYETMREILEAYLK